MEIIKWEPFNEFDRFFQDRSVFGMQKLGGELAVDIYEEKGNIIAKMTLPDTNIDDLEISLDQDVLTIAGRREEEKETKNKEYYSKEIRRGTFSRSMALPKAVDAEQASSEYKNGVLIVTMPVIAGAKNKTVKVPIKQ